MSDRKSPIIAWVSIMVTLILGLVGTFATWSMNDRRHKDEARQKENRAVEMLAQIWSQEEQAKMGFRQNIFSSLYEEVLQQDRPMHERITMLGIFVNNFDELFNPQMLFKALAKEIGRMPVSSARDELRGQLLDLAREVSRAQAARVGTSPHIIRLSRGQVDTVFLQFREEPHAGDEEGDEHGDDGAHHIQLQLVEVLSDAAVVQLTVDGAPPITFGVSYFDAPFFHNTLLPDRHRIAVTLRSIQARVDPRAELSVVELSVIEFPAEFVTTAFRPTIVDVRRMLATSQ